MLVRSEKQCPSSWFIKGTSISEIQAILDVSLGSITGWKQAYEQYGIEGLRLNHKGRKSAPSCTAARRSLKLAANKRNLGTGRTGI